MPVPGSTPVAEVAEGAAEEEPVDAAAAAARAQTAEGPSGHCAVSTSAAGAVAWACGSCTYKNLGAADECEVCKTARPAPDPSADTGMPAAAGDGLAADRQADPEVATEAQATEAAAAGAGAVGPAAHSAAGATESRPAQMREEGGASEARAREGERSGRPAKRARPQEKSGVAQMERRPAGGGATAAGGGGRTAPDQVVEVDLTVDDEGCARTRTSSASEERALAVMLF